MMLVGTSMPAIWVAIALLSSSILTEIIDVPDASSIYIFIWNGILCRAIEYVLVSSLKMLKAITLAHFSQRRL